MGNLFQKVSNIFTGFKKEKKILLLGLDAAGKTTILYKLQTQDVNSVVPCLGFNYEEKIYHKNIKFLSWDLGGCQRISWRKEYLKGSDSICFVIDSSDYDRLEIAKEELDKLLEEESVKEIPLLIFANKMDLKYYSVEDIAKNLNLQSIQRDWNIVACCALTGEGLQDGIDWIIEKMKQKEQQQHD